MPLSILYFHKMHFPSASGQTIQILRDYAAMARRGHGVHLFYRSVSALTTEEKRKFLIQYEADGAPGLVLHHVPEKGGFGRHMEKTTGKLLEKRSGPMALVTRTPGHAARVLRLIRRQKSNDLAVILEMHETAIPHMVYLEAGRRIRAWVSRIQEKKVFASVNAILCNAPPQKDLLRQRFARLAPMMVLPNSFDADAFEKAGAEKKTGRFRIRYAGQFSNWKNPEIMIEALGRLPHDTVLELAGGKPEEENATRERIAEWAKKHKVENRVFYFGFLQPNQVPVFLKGADCLVLPLGDNVRARCFTSPMKLFEYAASNVPMVATALPTISSLIQDHTHALLVPPESSHDLARAVSAIRSQPENAAQMAKRAESWVKNHSARMRARRYETFLRRILPRAGE